MDIPYPYIENGKWKLFDKTYQEQTEADKILFDGFFSALKKHIEFLNPTKVKEYTVIVSFRCGDNTGWTGIKVNATSEEEAINKASLPPRYKIFSKQIY
ncbi:hypothetical protein AS361_03880 [Myroides marinus]|jgi:hypothetical protein|uniref:hypothetical protein n=1 Tax=Myroides marinus TaxID=703342 RepID=UPI0007423010|nr:hypothetical protein [Myroides marinus]KUF38996.1 hypothetical protein AS361_03880 [Myroides marinus]